MRSCSYELKLNKNEIEGRAIMKGHTTWSGMILSDNSAFFCQKEVKLMVKINREEVFL